ncbi:hypothetical protein [uncultured Bifidobacterium sp.]|uniref:hypothetical protein n=1 Tax=uncultured Bifidobacterium sp. TaxID=165187 RepID=UPI002596395E|nr:hypothetical protein [uncultured Bifidobacterium sp.]
MNGEDERDLVDKTDWDYYAAGLWRPNSRYPTYTTSEPKSVSPEEAANLMARYDKASNQWILDQMKIEASKFIDINY